jgi:hypothetical protein
MQRIASRHPHTSLLPSSSPHSLPMRKGFLSTPKASTSKSQLVPVPPRTTPVAPPPTVTFNAHPRPNDVLGIHWAFVPRSATPEKPTADCALCLTRQTVALLASTSYWTSQAPLPPAPSPPLWTLVDVPGKGKGIVATCDIPAGVVVMMERPLFVWDPKRSPPRTHLETVFREALSYMRPDRRAVVMGLANAFQVDGTNELLGIVETNGYECMLVEGDDTSYTVVGDTFSRINHSCSPNVLPVWDTKTFSVGIQTTRTVKQGEEFSVTYIIPMQKRQQRREELLVKVGRPPSVLRLSH